MFSVKKMKRFVFILLLFVTASVANAQAEKPFVGRLANDEFQIYLVIDFYHNNIIVPGQEIFGEVSGYLADVKNTYKWIITEGKTDNKNTAKLVIINDYGSEDLTATLTINKDGTYSLKQIQGSALKIVRNRKWMKLPKTLVFVKK